MTLADRLIHDSIYLNASIEIPACADSSLEHALIDLYHESERVEVDGDGDLCFRGAIKTDKSTYKWSVYVSYDDTARRICNKHSIARMGRPGTGGFRC